MLRNLRAVSSALVFTALALGAAPDPAAGQVSVTTLGVPHTQSFDTLLTSGSTTWTNNSTIPGWFHARTGTGTTIVANDGSSNAGNLYSYGTGTATDRALGSVGSGNAAVGNLFWGVRLQNNTGATITALDVSYTGEQWRNSAAAAQTVAFSYLVGSPTVTGSLAEFQSAGVAVAALDFTSPITGGAAGALNGNLAANRTAKTFSITGLSIPNGTEVMLRWADPDHTGADHGLSIDDFSVTAQGAPPALPTLSIDDIPLNEGNAGITNFTFTVSLSTPAGPGGVTFDIATADGTAQDDNPVTEDNDYVANIPAMPQTIPSGNSTFAFTVQVNGDAVAETDETFFVNVTNVTGATVTDGQGQGTIVNDDLSRIHDVQGNGAATPLPGATVTVEGIVTADFQATGQLQSFFLQEEDADFDADPATSEGIRVFCGACATAVAEGQRVRVTGTVSEFFGNTEITAGTVVVTDAGNNLAQVTPAVLDLPVVGVIDDFYEPREGMLVTFADTLTVAEYFEQARFGHLELYEGGRPHQFTATSAPGAAGFAAHLAALDRRRVILDDDDNAQNAPHALPDGSQFAFHPQANGGLSVGIQGTDFFRGGDQVVGLTGVLHWSFAGVTGTDAWRIRPTAAAPAAFTVANSRPATPPAVGGAIRAASVNLLNYFTTIDTTASNNTGTCGPSGTQDCRGADSVAELNRQRERASIVLCGLDAHVIALMELENTASTTVTDLLGAVNARCGGADPYDFVDTGGTLGTDAIRVQLIYRSATLAPVGAPLVDLDPVHNRPPTAQTFDVIDSANPAFGERFTAVANHFKSKGCDASAVGPDADALDGQSCYNGARVAQANRLLAWVSGTVLPAAGDPDVLLLGDFNSYAQEDPITALEGAGFTDLETALLGAAAYSFLFDGQLGHLDYALSSASLTPQVTGVGAWHINADENPLFDYSDEIRDTGEAAFEEKPDGSALGTPRVVFQPASPFRASDHDPVLLGLFQIADLSVTKEDSPDPVTAGTNLTYTITVANNGPDPAAAASWSDTLPAGTAFVSLPDVTGWTCSTPAVGAGGTVSCSNPTFAVGSAVFTLTVAVAPSVAAGTVLSNTAEVDSDTGEGNPGDESATATTTVATSADLTVTKVDNPDPVTAGQTLTWTITIANAGPSDAAGLSLNDALPAGTTFVSLTEPADWGCSEPPVGANGTVTCTAAALPAGGSAVFTLVATVDGGVANGTVLTNNAVVTSATGDPNPGAETGTAMTTVGTAADLTVTKVDTPDPVGTGQALTWTITIANAGPSAAADVVLNDALPAGTTFASLSEPAGWGCTEPPVGTNGTVTCTISSLPVGSAVFTLVANVDAGVANGTVLTNNAVVTSETGDPNPGGETGTATTTVTAPLPALSGTKTVSGTFEPGGTVTYTVVVTNTGTGPQPDNPGDEVTDVLPAELALVSASATSGLAVPTIATNTVTWNGSLAPGASVTITIQATIVPDVAPGTTITNQAQLSFDADGNGSNEASGVTDDPAGGGAGDPTTFAVAGQSVVEVPVLDGLGLALLAVLLALGGLALLRR